MAGVACEEIWMNRISKTYSVESKAVDPAQGIYECMISTESVDRDGDVLLAMGCDVGAYMKNPVIFYGHSYFGANYPVAKTLSLDAIPGHGIKATFQFPPVGTSEQADTVHKLWASGFLNAASVGFRAKPNGWQWRQDQNGEELARGRLFTDWELLEWSVVGVPANADALRLAIGELVDKGYDREVVEELFGVKRGRVLSAKNEEKIRQAVAALKEVLASLGGDQSEPEDDETEEDSFTIDELKPFPNEHACRLRDPDDFEPNSFRRVSRSTDGKKYAVIMGKLKGETTMTEQSYRYPKDDWTVAAARSHCKSHDGITFEPATESIFRELPEGDDPAPNTSEPPINESSEDHDFEELSKILLQGLSALQEMIK